ncbi:hypothetical protein GJA_110 [Janthinobacterium agaricidamnosum NBRC 102515 = DSM 9628]|uniref:Uncharacterized protein n=1 Tax=Janthinobacterium agaricidamnosum NBRC 102515 = DSM 9628 TaxID=1349767 RepID=W0V0B6_9BURK|nr:hypothetical protein GJA_110 [Janthinobacterium agaricidamnosum NBRC 102515 = DSM 9628]
MIYMRKFSMARQSCGALFPQKNRGFHQPDFGTCYIYFRQQSDAA